MAHGTVSLRAGALCDKAVLGAGMCLREDVGGREWGPQLGFLAYLARTGTDDDRHYASSLSGVGARAGRGLGSWAQSA